MAQNEEKDRPGEIGSVEVEPLTDSDLESASGGIEVAPDSNNANSCCVSNVANGCCGA